MIELESGTLSLPPSRTDLPAAASHRHADHWQRPAMTLDNATFTADFSTREPTFSQAVAGGVAPLVATFQKLQFDTLSIKNSSVRIKMWDGSRLDTRRRRGRRLVQA